MNKIISCLIALSITFQSFSQNKIVFSGKTIEVNKIPRNKALIIDWDENTTILKKGKDTVRFDKEKIYKSLDNNFFVITEHTAPILDKSGSNTSNSQGNSTIELLDAKGRMIWKKVKNLNISDCMISRNGKFVHTTLWTKEFSDEKELETYNYSGDLVKSYKNTLELHKGDKGEILYLTRTNENNKYELVCYNTISNKEWKHISDSYVSILAVSADENFIFLSSDSYVYSYNSSGKKLWEKPNIGLGLFSISQNGKYLLRMPGNGDFEIYNNMNGVLMQKKEKILINNMQYLPSIGSFVCNSEIIVFCGNLNLNKSRVVFMKLNGELIKDTTIDKSFESYPYFEYNSANKISVFYDGLFVTDINLK